ncbi:MAG: GUN4 domain-containing protein [Rhizonema sp. PD38]|nr:GUN4 domain-containing protein [Rhizonema sp. PD38]
MTYRAAAKREQADQETARVMLAVTEREEEGWLEQEDIDSFPSLDLFTTNELWVKYSNGQRNRRGDQPTAGLADRIAPREHFGSSRDTFLL